MPDCAAICLTISCFVASSGSLGEGTPTLVTEDVEAMDVGGLLGVMTGVLKASCEQNVVIQEFLFLMFS